MALVTVLAIIVGIAYLALTPSRYTARVDMIIDTKRVTWTQSDMATENRMVEDASVESEIETTKSEKVATAVARNLKLTEDPEFVGTGHSLRSRVFSLLGIDTGLEQQPSNEEVLRRVLSTLKDNLRVMRVGRSYIEQISYTSLDRDKAARIANAFAEAYIEDQLQAKFEATHRASTWLEQRIRELRQQFSDAYKAVQDFKSQNGIIIGVDGKLASEVELDQLGIALAKARADTSQARAKLDRIGRVLEQRHIKGTLEIPDPVVTDALNNPVITRLRQQYLDDQSKESEWSARYGVDHQAARNLRAEMAALQRAIWDEISRISESYKSELQIARSQEESIDKRMMEVFQSVCIDPAIAGSPARIGDGCEHLSWYLRNFPVPFHAVRPAAVVPLDRGQGRYSRDPSRWAKLAEDRFNAGLRGNLRACAWNLAGVPARANEPANSHPRPA